MQRDPDPRQLIYLSQMICVADRAMRDARGPDALHRQRKNRAIYTGILARKLGGQVMVPRAGRVVSVKSHLCRDLVGNPFLSSAPVWVGIDLASTSDRCSA